MANNPTTPPDDSRTEPKPDSVPVICPKCGQPSYRCECANADQPANSPDISQTTAKIEAVAMALWRLDNPEDDNFSIVAPNDWDAWPESARAASLAYVAHSKDEYREQARVAIAALEALNV